jgi:hypothetical protein
MSKPKKKRPYTGRDYHLVGIIKGANKAYVEKDQKKEANKKASRSKVDPAEFDGEDGLCRQCSFPYSIKGIRDKDEIVAMECGFCSTSCMDYYSEK